MLQYLEEYGQYVEITGYSGIAFERQKPSLSLIARKQGKA